MSKYAVRTIKEKRHSGWQVSCPDGTVLHFSNEKQAKQFAAKQRCGSPKQIVRTGVLGRVPPERMRCATFAKTHGREAENYAASGNLHLDRECDVAQAKAMLDGAAMHRKWMLEKARECTAEGKKIDRAEVVRINRALVGKIRSLQARLRRPCTPKAEPVVGPIQTRWHKAQKGR